MLLLRIHDEIKPSYFIKEAKTEVDSHLGLRKTINSQDMLYSLVNNQTRIRSIKENSPQNSGIVKLLSVTTIKENKK